MRALGIRSFISVPLRSRGRVIAALTLVSADSDRRDTEADLHLAEELAPGLEVARLTSLVRALLDVSRITAGTLEPEPRLFEKFQRLASECHASGLGLGLWIVKQVLDAMRGHIQVDSAVGPGATFTVVLPREIRAA